MRSYQGSERGSYSRCFRRSGEHWSWTAWSSLAAFHVSMCLYVFGSLAVWLTFELTLAERGAVAGDDDELGLAGAESLEGGLVAQSDCR